MKRIMLALALASVLIPAPSAFADVPAAENTVAVLRLTTVTVTIIQALVVPIVTGLLTKASLSSAAKGLMTLVLNAVASLINVAVTADGTAVLSEATLINFGVGLAISVATYLGVYKPAGLTSAPGGRLAPTVGIGK